MLNHTLSLYLFYGLLLTGSEERLRMITTIVTETERNIKTIYEELVELGDGLPELSTGLSCALRDSKKSFSFFRHRKPSMLEAYCLRTSHSVSESVSLCIPKTSEGNFTQFWSQMCLAS